jgi:hypothetical protein
VARARADRAAAALQCSGFTEAAFRIIAELAERWNSSYDTQAMGRAVCEMPELGPADQDAPETRPGPPSLDGMSFTTIH